MSDHGGNGLILENVGATFSSSTAAPRKNRQKLILVCCPFENSLAILLLGLIGLIAAGDIR